MIDPTIRARLLALPGEFRDSARAILQHQEELRYAKEQRELCKAALLIELAAKWEQAKLNESIRKVQADAALVGDELYMALEKAVANSEGGIRLNQMMLDSLRFESTILIAVANNDSGFAEDPYAGERPALRQG